MVAPLVAAALIGGGATLIGGAMASRAQSKANDQNAALQREFAQYGIRWKVKDARAAGLHPLYAMGAQTNAASPSYQSDPMGQYVAQAGKTAGGLMESGRNRSARNVNASKQRQLVQDQIRLEQIKVRSQLRVDAAQANLLNAQAAKLTSPQAGDGATNFGIQSEDVAAPTGQFKPKPREVIIAKTGKPSQAAGPPEPAWQSIQLTDDPRIPKPLQTLRVPTTDEGWADDFMEKIPVIAAANWLRYSKWLTTDDIKAMYMTPYGRLKMLNMARKKAPKVLKALVEKLMQKHRREQRVEDGLHYGP